MTLEWGLTGHGKILPGRERGKGIPGGGADRAKSKGAGACLARLGWGEESGLEAGRGPALLSLCSHSQQLAGAPPALGSEAPGWGGSGPGERESRPPTSSFPIGPRRGFGERLRRLRRVLADLGVLVRGGQGACLTAVVFPTDRSGMENSASVEQLQETLLRALRALVLKNRPSETSRFTKLLLKLPDLRTLNNMHSEKLLSFRVDAQ